MSRSSGSIAATNQASAVFAYDVAQKHMVPGRITDCATCRCEPALRGVRVPVRPHIGTAGVAPNASGRISSVPPGLHGSNIDNWRIGAGAAMYHPVQVPGALFSLGDPHISQGDGEISGAAIDAYSLMSVAADFAVTQVVDGRQGVHCRIARDLFSCDGVDPDHAGS